VGARSKHQLGAVDAVIEAVTQRIHRPHERLPVGNIDRGAVQRLSQLRILLSGHNRVDIADTHVASLAGERHGIDPLDYFRIVRFGDLNAYDFNGRR
jgi:hypothetical protein